MLAVAVGVVCLGSFFKTMPGHELEKLRKDCIVTPDYSRFLYSKLVKGKQK